ncbi:hypothetical protein C8J56DRAFT_1159827 [Mycena floridula]|nr:hypothetical protein C8J56DRAFT_1159827 [Mycena floridula]
MQPNPEASSSLSRTIDPRRPLHRDSRQPPHQDSRHPEHRDPGQARLRYRGTISPEPQPEPSSGPSWRSSSCPSGQALQSPSRQPSPYPSQRPHSDPPESLPFVDKVYKLSEHVSHGLQQTQACHERVDRLYDSLEEQNRTLERRNRSFERQNRALAQRIQGLEDQISVLSNYILPRLRRPCTVHDDDPEYRTRDYPPTPRAPQYHRNSAFDVERSMPPELIVTRIPPQTSPEPTFVALESDENDEETSIKLEDQDQSVLQETEDEEDEDSSRRYNESRIVEESVALSYPYPSSSSYPASFPQAFSSRYLTGPPSPSPPRPRPSSDELQPLSSSGKRKRDNSDEPEDPEKPTKRPREPERSTTQYTLRSRRLQLKGLHVPEKR